ncbi:MAG: MFS transporter [Actinobacteria bacterium]|nr:MFS transporter [Actinomycetota bacterium]
MTVPAVSPDGRLLIVSRGVRGVADGAVAVALSAYLTHLGFSGRRIGLIVTCMLIGSALLTLLVGLRGHHMVRRRTLQIAAITMVATGLVYATSTTFAVLLIVGFIGTLNPSGGDVSIFAPIEQSLVPATTADHTRTAVFARYAFVGSVCGAIGSLSAGLPDWLAGLADADPDAALRWVFVAYALAGVAVFAVYRSLSPAVEPPSHERPTPLGPSRPIVMRLAAVFSLDSFGGGFVVQSLLALWLFRRYDLSVPAAGALLFWMGVCAAVSAFASARLAKRIGLVRTMVFTHMPAQVFLIAAALMPRLWLAVVFLILRSLLSAMDVPARNSYVMAVVSPPERAAAASVTNVPRGLAAALPPVAAGWMLDHSTFGWPLVLAGSIKLVYDVLLLMMFRNLRPPEEQVALAG